MFIVSLNFINLCEILFLVEFADYLHLSFLHFFFYREEILQFSRLNWDVSVSCMQLLK